MPLDNSSNIVQISPHGLHNTIHVNRLTCTAIMKYMDHVKTIYGY